MRRFFCFFWVAFFGLSAIALAEETVREQWMEILMDGKKVGFAYQKVSKIDSGYKLVGKSVIKLAIMDTVQDISSSSTYFLDEDLKPQRYTYIQKMLNHRQFFEGVIKGGSLHLTITSGGSVTKKTVPFPDDTYLADAINFIVGEKELRAGQEFKYKIFLEPLLAYETITVKVGDLRDFNNQGKTEKAFTIESHFKSFKVTSIVTPDGRVLKETSPMGFESYATSREKAVTFDDDIVPFTNLLTYSLITPNRSIARPEELAGLKLKVYGLSRKNLIPSDERQAVSGGIEASDGSHTIDLATKKIDAATIKKIQRPAPAQDLSRYLRATFEAQSDDPLIRRQSKAIVGSEPDVYASAAKINRWVYKNVEKKFVDTFSAVATLKALEGECQSHTNLFTALARSAGIPTRTVSGIVYSQQFSGWLYHAWPEIYAGKWIAMDPTFGQDIADATHIKLLEGDLSKQLEIFEFIGKIGIEIVSENRKQ